MATIGVAADITDGPKAILSVPEYTPNGRTELIVGVRPESVASGELPKPGEDRHLKELIDHLSKEIITISTAQQTFRTKAGFTILIGPFIVLGAFFVATRGKIKFPKFETLDWRFYAACTAAIVAYLALGVYCSALDILMAKHCRLCRKEMSRLSHGYSGTAYATGNFEDAVRNSGYRTGGNSLRGPAFDLATKL